MGKNKIPEDACIAGQRAGKRDRGGYSLKNSDAWYRQFIENQPVGMFRTSVQGEGRFLMANAAMAGMLGHPSVESLLQTPVVEMYRNPESRKELVERLIREEQVFGQEIDGKRRDGSPLCIRMSLRLIRDSGGNPDQIDGTLEDITPHRQAEAALKKREQLHRKAQRIARLGHWEVVHGCTKPDWSEEMYRIFEFDREEFDGTFEKFLDRIHPDDRKIVSDSIAGALQNAEEINHVHRILLPDGRIKFIHAMGQIEKDWAGSSVRLIGTCQDVTTLKEAEIEREKTERKLRQAQKLEAIGTLVGGIAHDFNNILTSMIGFTQLAINALPPDSPITRRLDVVLQGGMRARDLVMNILAFSRESEKEFKPTRLAAVIEEAVHLLRASIPANIEIEQKITSSRGLVFADSVQIHQIVMNLCTNAYQAIGKKNGKIAILLEAVEGGSSGSGDGVNLPSGNYLHLAISDTGCGMDKATLEKMFDPYFTTKKRGEGTGLGLSVVHGIVEDHRGHIFVSSQPGRGTAFDLFFPTLDTDSGEEAVAKEKPMPGGTEHIVIVDDEVEIANLLGEMLTSLGYRVTIFTDSLKALEFVKSWPAGYDLLLTDLTMPAVCGDELARIAVTMNPGMPVVLCTGFIDTLNARSAREVGIRACLTKPVMLSELAACIRAVLNPEIAAHPSPAGPKKV